MKSKSIHTRDKRTHAVNTRANLHELVDDNLFAKAKVRYGIGCIHRLYHDALQTGDGNDLVWCTRIVEDASNEPIGREKEEEKREGKCADLTHTHLLREGRRTPFFSPRTPARVGAVCLRDVNRLLSV